MVYQIIKRFAYLFNALKANFSNKNVKVKYNCRIRPESYFEGVNRVSDRTVFKGYLGKYSYIGEDSFVNAKIGRFCSIGPRVRVISGRHPTSYVSTSPIFFSTKKQCGKSFIKEDIFKELYTADENDMRYPVIIGNDVWVGDSVIIKAGTRIGDGAIVGMGAVVTKDVPPYAIVAGNPAHIIRYRFDDETIKRIVDSKWWDWDEKKLREKANLISDITGFINEGEQYE